MWDVETGKCLFQARSQAQHLFSVACDRDGRRIVTGGKKHIEVWDAGTGESAYTFAAHDSSVYVVAFAPDGRQLFSAGGDGTVKLWKVLPSRTP
jgi:WD40 repeat protein